MLTWEEIKEKSLVSFKASLPNLGTLRGTMARTKVFFDITIGGKKAGRITMEVKGFAVHGAEQMF